MDWMIMPLTSALPGVGGGREERTVGWALPQLA